MIDVPLKYQASLFLDASDLGPNPATISKLLVVLGEDGMIPTNFQEMRAPGLGLTPRLRFATPDNASGIDFGSGRIDIERNGILPKAANMGGAKDFCGFVVKTAGKLLSAFPRRAHRLSLVTKFICAELPPGQLDAIYKKLFLPTPVYQKKPPFEWNWRCASSDSAVIDGRNEALNIITALNRATGTMQLGAVNKQFDRVFIDLDINTKPTNADTRFDAKGINSFFDYVGGAHDAVLDETIKAISVGYAA